MNQTQINSLISERTILRDAAQASLDEALALIPDPLFRYRVDLSGVTPIDVSGFATESFSINGEFVNQNAGINGWPVHADAQRVGHAIYETLTPSELPPPVVIVWNETTTETDWVAI